MISIQVQGKAIENGNSRKSSVEEVWEGLEMCQSLLGWPPPKGRSFCRLKPNNHPDSGHLNFETCYVNINFSQRQICLVEKLSAASFTNFKSAILCLVVWNRGEQLIWNPMEPVEASRCLDYDGFDVDQSSPHGRLFLVIRDVICETSWLQTRNSIWGWTIPYPAHNAV